jgi:hypothetical protein
MEYNPALSRLQDLFELVRLKPSAVGLACAMVCMGTFAQSQTETPTQGAGHYGTTARDTPGSTRLYNLPLASELPADPTYCATTEAQAVAYATNTWSGTGQRPAIEVYECRRERIVQSVVPGEQLRDVVLGNVFVVQANGSVNYRSRGVGTFEKTTTAAAPSYAPTPAPAPAGPISGSAWWGSSPYTSGTVMVLYWAGVNATEARVHSCTSAMSASGLPPTANKVDGPMYGGTVQCTVQFTNASGQTYDAVAVAYEDTASAPAPAPICTLPQVWSGGACVTPIAGSPPPPAPPPPAPAPSCPAPLVWDVSSQQCIPSTTAPPPPAPVACAASPALIPAINWIITGYSTHGETLGQPIYSPVAGTFQVGSLPGGAVPGQVENFSSGISYSWACNSTMAPAGCAGYAQYVCSPPSWGLSQDVRFMEGQP